MSESLRSYLDFAVETAFVAGRMTLGYFQAGVRPDFKSDDTPVTVADRKTEELIRQRIETAYPTHSIVGEEYGTDEGEDAGYRWFVDPIDGTKSFVRGVPLYSVLIGLEIEGSVEVGVAYFPGLGEMVAAATGEGCWWNGRRAWVSQTANLSNAYVASGDSASFAWHGRGAAWERIKQRAYFRGGWGDAYGHCLVATGRADLMLDPIMSDWDCGPFPPILREAGGYFGDWDGNVTIYGKEALSTNAALLPEVLALIREA